MNNNRWRNFFLNTVKGVFLLGLIVNLTSEIFGGIFSANSSSKAFINFNFAEEQYNTINM